MNFLHRGALLLAAAWPVHALQINEVLPENEGGLQDADLESPGWIELYNETNAAVNLTGWRLTDDPAILDKWVLPAQSLAANGYLVVFASEKNRAVAGLEWHTNFQLDPDGEYLALVRPDATIAQAISPGIPKLRRNVSFAQTGDPMVTPLIAEGAAVRWSVPLDGAQGVSWTSRTFNDAAWPAGPAGLGFDTAGGSGGGSPVLSIDVNDRDSNTAPNTEAGWQAFVIGDTGGNAAVQTGAVARTFGSSTVTVQNSGADGYDDRLRTTPVNSGDFTQQNLLRDFFFSRDQSGTTGLDITIAGLAANQPYKIGIWSFDTSSTGNRVSDWTANGVLVKENYAFNGSTLPFNNDTYRFEFTTASDAGGQVLIQGRRDPSSSTFGVFLNALQVTPVGFGGLIGTNTGAAMQGVNSSLYARVPFTITDAAATAQLRLRLRYDDGVFIYVNGTLLANRNAPVLPAWNAAAMADRDKGQASAFEEILLNLPPGLLVNGTNVLALHGLSQGAADTDFLLSPMLAGIGTSVTAGRYYATPTPGAANSAPFNGLVTDTQFSADRGHFDAPFNVTLACATPGAQIRYTTDGSAPAAATGTVYSAPINVSGTTILRAAAFLPGFVPSNVDTQSYLYRTQAANQPANPPGWPLTWGINSEVNNNDGAGNGTVPANYEMDPNVRNNTTPGYSVEEALAALPSLSVAMAPGDFTGPNGIYQNPQSTGQAWEKPCSLEFMEPDGSVIFKETCGIEVHGNSSRRPWRMQKHSFRVSFKGEYGAARLRKRLFAETSLSSFNKLILRACFTDSWGLVSWDQGRYRPDDSVYFRDIWMKRSAASMGSLQPVSRFAHLYINGLYWGVFDVSEKTNEDFAADHAGGRPDQWDILADFNELKAGDTVAWDAMFALGAQGLSDQARYIQLGAQYLDVPAFADYYLLHIFAWCEDWPSHNWYVMRRRDVPDKFRFLVWDQEIALDNTTFNRIGDNTDKSPGRLFQYLRTNPEFRLLFADRVQRHVFNGGALSLVANQNRWSGLAAQLDKAIVAESARWGDTADETPYGNASSKPVFTREGDWLPTVNSVRNVYLPSLYNNANSFALIPRLRANSLFPAIDAPVLSQHGGNVSPGYSLSMTAAAGTIYYTFNGSDPRQAVTGTATGTPYGGPIALTQTVVVKARALNAGVWSALTEATFIVGTAASAANVAITEVMYHPTEPATWEFIELMNIAAETIDLTGVSFTAGLGFDFAPGTLLGPGQRLVLVSDPAAFALQYPGISVHGTFTGRLENNGEQIALSAADHADIRRFTYNDKLPWPVAADGLGHSMTLVAPARNPDHADPFSWRASVDPGGSPGAGDAIAFAGNSAADSDGDGLSDFAEYALAGTLPAIAPPVDGVPAVILTRRAGADDAIVSMEFSTDLAAWNPVAASELRASTIPSPGLVRETWTLSAPGAPHAFMRARISPR